MKTTTLVVLAAGRGSRYGGTKQLDAITPEGETIVDFSLFDALRSGFRKFVFIVRRSILEDARRLFDARLGGRADVRYICQELEPGTIRKKPYGTGHAVLTAKDAVDEDFCVINADDFYGQETYELMAEASDGSFGLAGYQLGATLSSIGPVSRAQCVVDAAGSLTEIVERTGIKREGQAIVADEVDEPLPVLTEDTVVSTNFWAFTPAVFGMLSESFRKFLTEKNGEDESEFYINDVMREAVKSGRGKVTVRRSKGIWIGVTYRADKEPAAARIAELRRRGLYPAALW